MPITGSTTDEHLQENLLGAATKLRRYESNVVRTVFEELMRSSFDKPKAAS